MRLILEPIKTEFVRLFQNSANFEKNRKFLGHVSVCFFALCIVLELQDRLLPFLFVGKVGQK